MNLDERAHIVYPCEWEYRIIGENENRLKEIVFELMPKEYKIQNGKQSSQKRFVSIYVWVMVQNEQERNMIFSLLSHHPEIKMVI